MNIALRQHVYKQTGLNNTLGLTYTTTTQRSVYWYSTVLIGQTDACSMMAYGMSGSLTLCSVY